MLLLDKLIWDLVFNISRISRVEVVKHVMGLSITYTNKII
jgi:hypothetical protein